MAQLQKGHCAFTNGCIHVNERHILIEGTNRVMCASHAALMSLPTVGEANGNEFAGSTFRPSRASGHRRSRWATYVGVSEGSY